jgi:hypothetical protein
MPNHWIVTCNPKRWDIWQYLAEGGTMAEIDAWSVTRYFAELQPGDDVALWIAGKDRGVYAVGTITGTPFLATGDEHWTDEADRNRQRRYLPISLGHDLTDAPLLAADLKEDPRFADATVLTFPRAGNPHRLDQRQWQAIADRL